MGDVEHWSLVGARMSRRRCHGARRADFDKDALWWCRVGVSRSACSEGTREEGPGGFRDRTSASAAKRELGGKTARAPGPSAQSSLSRASTLPRHMHILLTKDSLLVQSCTSLLPQT